MTLLLDKKPKVSIKSNCQFRTCLQADEAFQAHNLLKAGQLYSSALQIMADKLRLLHKAQPAGYKSKIDNCKADLQTKAARYLTIQILQTTYDLNKLNKILIKAFKKDQSLSQIRHTLTKEEQRTVLQLAELMVIVHPKSQVQLTLINFSKYKLVDRSVVTDYHKTYLKQKINFLEVPLSALSKSDARQLSQLCYDCAFLYEKHDRQLYNTYYERHLVYEGYSQANSPKSLRRGIARLEGFYKNGFNASGQFLIRKAELLMTQLHKNGDFVADIQLTNEVVDDLYEASYYTEIQYTTLKAWLTFVAKLNLQVVHKLKNLSGRQVKTYLHRLAHKPASNKYVKPEVMRTRQIMAIVQKFIDALIKHSAVKTTSADLDAVLQLYCKDWINEASALRCLMQFVREAQLSIKYCAITPKPLSL